MKNPFTNHQNSATPIPPATGTRPSRPTPSRNPFGDFRDLPPRPARQIPLDDILADHEASIDWLVGGYHRLVVGETGEGIFQPDGDTIARMYDAALEIASDLDVSAGDLEAFALMSVRSDDPDFLILGPLGIYISALCNTSAAADLRFDLTAGSHRLPLIGYRLPENRSVSIRGDLNDLIGISLEGGQLTIEGSVGRYLGAGMVGGVIEVRGDAGRFSGQQMVAGQIHVHGRLDPIGNPEGGEIFHKKRRLFPSENEKQPPMHTGGHK